MGSHALVHFRLSAGIAIAASMVNSVYTVLGVLDIVAKRSDFSDYRSFSSSYYQSTVIGQ